MLHSCVFDIVRLNRDWKWSPLSFPSRQRSFVRVFDLILFIVAGEPASVFAFQLVIAFQNFLAKLAIVLNIEVIPTCKCSTWNFNAHNLTGMRLNVNSGFFHLANKRAGLGVAKTSRFLLGGPAIPCQ